MDLSSMLEREDFFELLPRTVERYYHEAEQKNVRLEKVRHKGNFVIKPRLSALMSPKISKSARAFFYSEWNPRGSRLKNIAVRCYVFAMLHTGSLFSQYRFLVQPEDASLKDTVIAPNNRSIRFFDYRNGTVGCMTKDGFSDKYFQNQLQFRLNYHYPFMLPLQKWGDSWFVEPILKGHPLARVTDDEAYQKGISDALTDIRLLAADTSRTVSVKHYLKDLSERIRTLTAKAKENKNITTAEQTENLVRAATELTEDDASEMTLCMSHGDLQTGNIWVDQAGNTLIYDWETAGERSVWYDAAVLSYSLRKENGWREFLSDRAAKQAFFSDPAANGSRCTPMTVRAAVLLEDILFRLEDMMELPHDWGREIYDRYIMNLQKTVSEVGME